MSVILNDNFYKQKHKEIMNNVNLIVPLTEFVIQRKEKIQSYSIFQIPLFAGSNYRLL